MISHTNIIDHLHREKRWDLLKTHDVNASSLKTKADHKHGLLREPNGQWICLIQCLPIAKEPHHSVTIAIVTVSTAVHHSAYLIATDEGSGSNAPRAAVIEVPTAVAVGVPAAAIVKGTVGVSRYIQVIRAKVGVIYREDPNPNAHVC